MTKVLYHCFVKITDNNKNKKSIQSQTTSKYCQITFEKNDYYFDFFFSESKNTNGKANGPTSWSSSKTNQFNSANSGSRSGNFNNIQSSTSTSSLANSYSSSSLVSHWWIYHKFLSKNTVVKILDKLNLKFRIHSIMDLPTVLQNFLGWYKTLEKSK